MKKTVLIIIFFLSLFHINAQQKDFKKTLQEIEHLLYFPDTALFDDELIRFARFYPNGNVELASNMDMDTTRFNLHLLHAIYLDDDSTYNKFGLHLSESSVQLFLDPVMQEIGLDENDELVSKGSMLAFYSVTLRSPEQARRLADALINFRTVTEMDNKIFIRKN